MTYLSSFLLLQSFAKIAHASPEQLRRLPGFGQVKVRRIVDAFEKPFRNKATSAPLVTSTAGSEEANLESHDGGGADGVQIIDFVVIYQISILVLVVTVEVYHGVQLIPKLSEIPGKNSEYG